MTREDAKHIVDVAFGVPQAVRRSGEDRTYNEDEIREAKEMAIQALSQEPCEDCISRQALLDMREKIEYKDMWHMTQEEEVVSVSNIKALPPVTPKKEWIPVSERLPDIDDDVLATDGTDMFVAWHFGEHDDWGSFDANFDRYTEVVAWIPLPEPYRSEREE